MAVPVSAEILLERFRGDSRYTSEVSFATN